MSLEQWSPEELVTRLSYQSRDILKGMISISDPAKLSAVQHHDSLSSAGFLDNLPLELLHLICDLLDFRSLSRISRTSFLGKMIIESLPAYRDLMEFAPHTLSALGKTGLISVHSSAILHAELLSMHCVSCRKYGAFLFLPTCERCCYECLRRNQSLRVIPQALAKKCFNLTQTQLKTIPIMYSIPGRYFVGHTISRQRRQRLVSVKSAKRLAIMVHGSTNKVAELVPAQPPRGVTEKTLQEYHTFRYLLDAPLEPLHSDPLAMPSEKNVPSDDCCGMASIHFPSLTVENSLESGLWCRGCEYTFERLRFGKLSAHTVSGLSYPGVDPFFTLMGMQRRARSKSEFLDHIQCCYGVRKLLSQSSENHR